MRIFLLIFCLFPCALSAQSPWSRSKAGFFVQGAWQTIPEYAALFGENGENSTELARKVTENAFQLYGEYGVSSKTTVMAVVPVVFNKRGAKNPQFPYTFGRLDSGSIAGPGNVYLGVKHQFLAGKVALAGTLRVGLPVSEGQKNTGLRTGYDAFTVLPSLSVGMGLGRYYWFAYGGYGIRTNTYSHFVNAGAEAGCHLWKIWLIGFSEYLVSLENGSRPLPLSDVSSGLYLNDQGWLSVGLKSIVEFNRFWGLNLSATGAMWGQNVPKRPAFAFGAWFKWD
jgi:hypothetical protein